MPKVTANSVEDDLYHYWRSGGTLGSTFIGMKQRGHKDVNKHDIRTAFVKFASQV